MLLVGLTGGIGAGKSTVAANLAKRGAVIVSADTITRELQEPGEPVFEAIVERFGEQMLRADGMLDRPRLASRAFADAAAKRDLEAIVHPAIGEEMRRRVDVHRHSPHIVVYDVPLLVEGGQEQYDAVIVVDAHPEVAVRRLVDQRGMDEADVRARLGHQVSREDRLAAADYVIANSGTIDELHRQVDELWVWLARRRDRPHAR